MKIKTLIVLAAILVVLAGAGTWLMQRDETRTPRGVLGQPLFAELPVGRIAALQVTGPEASVRVTKGAERWEVEERHGYSAEFLRIQNVVRKLVDATVGRRFEGTDEVRKRLALLEPENTDEPADARGTRLELKDDKGEVFARVLMGAFRKSEEGGPGLRGQYVVLGDSKDVYLVDQQWPDLKSDPPSWMQRSLVRVSAGEVRSIVATGADKADVRFILERSEKGKSFELMQPDAEQEIEDNAVNRLAGALAALRMDDLEDPKKPPQAVAAGVSDRLEFTLYDGTLYRVFPGEVCEQGQPCFLRIEVGYVAPVEEVTPEPEGGGEKAEEVTAAEKGEKRAQTLNILLSPWVFRIPGWQHRNFETQMAPLLKEKQAPETRAN